MRAFICRTCGVQYAPSQDPPSRCIICEDERQYVGRGGQRWTTLDELGGEGYANAIVELEPGLHSVRTSPQLAIGQRALLVQTPSGNALWDCITLLDEATIAGVRALGGICAIGISHPHFYATSAEWARAFGATLYIPEADRGWVTYPGDHLAYWAGSIEVLSGVTLVQCGGHFEGSAVMHWEAGAGGRGALLTGDTMAVASDARFVSFMRSYPNLIPLPRAEIERIVRAVEPFAFDRLYGGFDGEVAEDAKAAVERSAARYIGWLEGRG